MFKKLAVLLAALAVSAPAFADRGHRDHYRGYGHRHVAVKHHYYRPAPRPVVQHVYYRPAPRPVYVAPRPVYVVEHHNHVNPVAVLAGAVIGAAIVHHVVTGY